MYIDSHRNKVHFDSHEQICIIVMVSVRLFVHPFTWPNGTNIKLFFLYILIFFFLGGGGGGEGGALYIQCRLCKLVTVIELESCI